MKNKRLILLVCLATLTAASTAHAQSGNSDRCTVTAVDTTGLKADNVENAKEVKLGEFDTVIGEEIGTTRTYRLPRTRLFVVAHVWYTDESLASEKGGDSIAIEITISKKRQRDVLSSLAYADAEFPLYDFDAARTSTKIRSGGRTFFVLMECHKKIRVNSKADSAYPAVWFAPINDPNKPDWEILPQERQAGEVILSKRNELGRLSNFAATPFELYGKRYASVEGFWQMMLYPEGPDDERAKDKRVTWKYTREQVAQMTAFEAKSAGTLAEENMKTLGIDWCTFQGKRFPYRTIPSGGLREPGEHYKLIVAAMRAKAEQNPEVKRILAATGDLILKPDHHGEVEPPPEWKYYEIWMQIRSELHKNTK